MAKNVDWLAIEGRYRVGASSVNAIAKEFGVTEGAIRSRAKKLGWSRGIGTLDSLKRSANGAGRPKGFGAEAAFEVVVGAQLLLGSTAFTDELGLPPMISVDKQVPTICGRIDFVIRHVDESVTAIEVKDSVDERELLAGVGQLFKYEAALKLSGYRSVRKALAILGGQLTVGSLLAMSGANVMLIPLGDRERKASRWQTALAQVG